MYGALLSIVLAQPPAATDGAVLIRAGGQVVSADQAGAREPVYSGAPIDLDVVNAELGNVLRLISAVSHLNFVLDDTVHGTVTAHLEAVPWDQALAVILQSKGLVAVPYGDNLLLVQPVGP